ncbi:hypothetical protein BCR33DRAFT_716841 [Rhizoclosmatium globosum]|uniref:Uncharacterized protein n=1 Tax=Rhizoclosmatium globosum TaxID=329046 RepID=A0A1Y2CDE9_9FUNG|nr:hypothetical protein BCR33DRAFT_716841 [Rhizoclosmatium globosum]|eukprot:ORY44927.1 hypothetical protein BCR33DRAFT_716841 [Rhizoclosmatium globosum]
MPPIRNHSNNPAGCLASQLTLNDLQQIAKLTGRTVADVRWYLSGPVSIPQVRIDDLQTVCSYFREHFADQLNSISAAKGKRLSKGQWVCLLRAMLFGCLYRYPGGMDREASVETHAAVGEACRHIDTL